MSEYTFKNLNEIDTVEEPADGTTMMGFQNGTPIQMPMSAVKSGGGVFIVDTNGPEFDQTDTAYGNKVKEALLSGKMIWVRSTFTSTSTSTTVSTYYNIVAFTITENATTSEGHTLSLSRPNIPPLVLAITL